MKIRVSQTGRAMAWLLFVSLVVRCILAAWMEFGNDEAYYWTYALFPDWSHFDHPGMVGWIIQLFSLNLRLDSEFFIRLSSVIFMTANTYIIYRIGKEIKDAQTGLYAALLYTASIYAFVITGVFILPDTPMSLFWFLAFWMFVRYFRADRPKGIHLVVAGLFAGLCMLSKYSGVFLWIGVGLYILFFSRRTLKKPSLYVALLISAICCFPILYWNMQNDWISFSFHGGRVGVFGKTDFSTLGTEIAGEFFYNNPINYILALIALISVFLHKIDLEETVKRLILLIALPMILTFLLFSLTKTTLPHWSAPAFNLLILLSAAMLSDSHPMLNERFAMPKTIMAALAVLLLTIVIGVAEIKTGFIPLDHHTEETDLGKDDFTLDMYGWRQLGPKFAVLRAEKIADGSMHEEDGIIADQWFPAANIDYYVARPLGMKVYGFGKTEKIHKYLWINEERGGINKGERYWFISDSHLYKDPKLVYRWKFHDIIPAGTIDIERNGKTVRHFFVYMCQDLVYPPKTLTELRTEKTQ